MIHRPPCIWCKHKNPRGADRDCKAFKIIPDEIIFGEHNHFYPFAGDGGVLFEPLENAPGWVLDAWPPPEAGK